jgi:hypothetical protein
MEDDFADRLIVWIPSKKAKLDIKKEIQKLQDELEEVKGAEPNVQKLLKKGIHVLEQFPQFYQRSSIEVKSDILGSIFPKKLQIAEDKCRTTK